MRTAMNMVGPYCHPLLVQSSPDSSNLLTMLTMREGGATASAPKRAEDVGVNDLGDGGAAMRKIKCFLLVFSLHLGPTTL